MQQGSIAQLVLHLTADSARGCKFVAIDNEVISMVIRPLLLIRDAWSKSSYQLLVKVCAQVLVNSLED